MKDYLVYLSPKTRGLAVLATVVKANSGAEAKRIALQITLPNGQSTLKPDPDYRALKAIEIKAGDVWAL